MKPGLLFFINRSLGEQFPLLPRIRRSFIGLLMFCILFLLVTYATNDRFIIAVEPVEAGTYANRPISTYAESYVQVGGQLTVREPSFLQSLLLRRKLLDLDAIMLLFLAAVSIIIIGMIPKLQQHTLFRKDISRSVKWIGYLMILHAAITLYRNMGYAPGEIERLTNHEFTAPQWFWVYQAAECYFAMMVIAMGGMFKRGMQLQEEQDLTV